MQALDTQLQDKINEMEEIDKYTINTLQQGAQILQKIQQQDNVQLTEEEIQVLSTSSQISQLASDIPAAAPHLAPSTSTFTPQPASSTPTVTPQLAPSTAPPPGPYTSTPSTTSASSIADIKSQPTSTPDVIPKVPSNIPGDICRPASSFPEATPQPTSPPSYPVKTKITTQFDNAIDEIRSMDNEEDIEKTVLSAVRNSEASYQNYCQQIQSKTAEISSTFEEDYKVTLSTVHSNDQLKEILQSIPQRSPPRSDESVKKFESYVAATRGTSTTPVTDMFNGIRQNSAPSSTNSQRSIKELQTLSQQVSKNIDSIEENANYARQTLKKASEILQTVRNSKDKIKLTEEEIDTLTVANRMAHVLSAPEAARQPVDVSAAKASLETVHQKTVSAIEATTNEEERREMVAQSVQNYGDVYKTFKKDIRAEVKEQIFDYEQNYKTAMNNKRVAAVLETIPETQGTGDTDASISDFLYE